MGRSGLLKLPGDYEEILPGKGASADARFGPQCHPEQAFRPNLVFCPDDFLQDYMDGFLPDENPAVGEETGDACKDLVHRRVVFEP